MALVSFFPDFCWRVFLLSLFSRLHFSKQWWYFGGYWRRRNQAEDLRIFGFKKTKYERKWILCMREESIRWVRPPRVRVALRCLAWGNLAPNCSTLNRETCSSVPHTYGSCLAGNIGESGSHNSICFNHDSCSLKKENIVHAHKSCPNNCCSGHEEFVLVDIIIITEFITASCLILTVIAIAYADMALRVAMCFYCGWATSQTAVPQRTLRKFAKPIFEFQKFCGDQAIFISIIAIYKIRFSWRTCLHLQRFNTCFIL